MNTPLALIGTLIVGAASGYFFAEAQAELKYREKYREYGDSLLRAYEMAAKKDAEKPAESEADLTIIDLDKDAVDEIMEKVKLPEVPETSTNPYHNVVSNYSTGSPEPVVTFVEKADVAQFSYIESEDYYDADGRTKEQIIIYLQEEGPPVFTELGDEIDDWMHRIPESIMADFYTKCPPGSDQVLYVRQNDSEVDYEVLLESP